MRVFFVVVVVAKMHKLMTRINVSCHCDDIRSKCRSGALIMSNWKMRRYIAYFNSNTVFPFSTDHLSELIKDMTNWLLSENFEWMIVLFVLSILVDYQQCQKKFPPDFCRHFDSFPQCLFFLSVYGVYMFRFVLFAAIAGCRYGAVVNTTVKSCVWLD